MGNACPTAKGVLEQVAVIAAAHKGHPEDLISVLREVQNVADNAIAEDVAVTVANEMDIPLAKVYGVVTFYAMFSTEPRGKNIIRMCKSAPCHVKGAAQVLEAFENELGIKYGETTPDGKFTLETCECLGICHLSPAALINDEVYGELSASKVKEILADFN